MSCISEIRNLCLYWVTGQHNTEALFLESFLRHVHKFITVSDRDTGCWGFSTYTILTHDSPIPIPLNLVMSIEIQLFSIHLYSTTCMEPRTPKHKETITNIIVVFSTPGSHTYLSYIRSTDMMQVDDQPSQVAQRDWMTGESCQDPLWPLNCI